MDKNVQKMTVFIFLFSFACTLAVRTALAQPAGNFLRIVNSPRAVAMGSGALTLIDQESVFYNPSAMALYHLDARVSVTSPFSTSWLPRLISDYRLRGSSLTLALKRNQTGTSVFSVGAFFQRFSYGRLVRLGPLGGIDGIDKPTEMAYGLSFGYAHSGKIKYGLGLTNRYINSRLLGPGGLTIGDATADALLVDVAALIEAPLSGSATERSQITARASILQTLIGGDLTYIDAQQADPTPKVNQIGVAFSASFGDPNLRGLSLLASGELDSDVSGAKNELSSKTRLGFEAGLFEMLYARVGAFDDDAVDGLALSYGAGFSLHGLLRLVNKKRLESVVKNGEHPFWRSVDLRVDVARIPDKDFLALSGTKFWKVSLAWLR